MTVAEMYLNDIWRKTKGILVNEGFLEEIVLNTYFEEASLHDINEAAAIITVKTHLQKVILIQEVEKVNSILNDFLIAIFFVRFY